MKSIATFIGSALVCSVLFFSCTKESPGVRSAAPPGPPENTIIGSIPLNGGTLTGSWMQIYYQLVSFSNDTFVHFDTTTVQPGVMMIEFRTNGTLLITEPSGTLSGTYEVTNNRVTCTVNNAVTVYAYGISASGKLRLYEVTTAHMLDNYLLWKEDYLYVRS